MTREEIIADWKKWMSEHPKEIKAHLSDPPEDWLADDGWDDVE